MLPPPPEPAVAVIPLNVESCPAAPTVTVTISGNFPNSSVAPITSVVSGINITTDYNTHWLIVGGGAGAGSGYVASGGGGGGVKPNPVIEAN